MSFYVDGFIAPVREDQKQEYIEFARMAANIFKECGALHIVENWADDVPEGKLTSLPMAIKLEPGEVVVFSWITWSSKASRDAGWQKFENDSRMNDPELKMPFDGKRMIFGGFSNIVHE